MEKYHIVRPHLASQSLRVGVARTSLSAALAVSILLLPIAGAAKGGGGHGGRSGGGHVSSSSAGGAHAVRGYTTKRGTYVAPHRATNPDSSKANNWSHKGNVNPDTGKRGTKN